MFNSQFDNNIWKNNAIVHRILKIKNDCMHVDFAVMFYLYILMYKI